jgi:hypothetical protein
MALRRFLHWPGIVKGFFFNAVYPGNFNMLFYPCSGTINGS